jgi:hypothetical protein
MEKAYDPKELVKIAKSKGLDIAEEAAKELIKSIGEWAQESAKLGQKPLVDGIVLVAVPVLEKFALEQADKIDGEVG